MPADDRTILRRDVLRLLAVAMGVGWAGAAAAQVCFDPAKLSGSDRSLRRSLNFRDMSPDPKRACGDCAFFAATGPAGCGRCAMLSGGPVAATSVCDSWAARG